MGKKETKNQVDKEKRGRSCKSCGQMDIAKTHSQRTNFSNSQRVNKNKHSKNFSEEIGCVD